MVQRRNTVFHNAVVTFGGLITVLLMTESAVGLSHLMDLITLLYGRTSDLYAETSSSANLISMGLPFLLRA